MQAMLFLRLSLLSDWQQIADDAAIRIDAQDQAICKFKGIDEVDEDMGLTHEGESPNTAPKTDETLKQTANAS